MPRFMRSAREDGSGTRDTFNELVMVLRLLRRLVVKTVARVALKLRPQ